MTSDVLLRDVTEGDLPIFFEQQLDPAANTMAAFTAKNPADRNAFMAHWTKILGDDTITKKTILFDGQVAGHVLSFEQFGTPAVSYWIGKAVELEERRERTGGHRDFDPVGRTSASRSGHALNQFSRYPQCAGRCFLRL